ncbi:MAG: hypothetical protein LBP26_03070 [Clostridiales bacterium]|jgi:hypothetical protein|nr:hypothetical protein [Clostridiales bacterium]
MKVRFKWLSVLLAALLMFAAAACGKNDAKTGEDPDGDGTGGGKPQTPVEEVVDPPAPVHKVRAVEALYNDAPVSGTLSVDLSAGSIAIGSRVTVTGQPEYTVTYASSDPSVATIAPDQNGAAITLVAPGETVITVTAGAAQKKIVLVVGSNYAPSALKYTVTVNGGTPSATNAEAGEYVSLRADIPAHNKFVRWTFNADGSEFTPVLNGNMMVMPAKNVVVTAVYEQMLYTLNVFNGTVKDTAEEGLDAILDSVTDGELGQKVYKMPYATEVTVVADPDAIADPTMFVGWDYKVKNNRVGDPGQKELELDPMPDATTTVWAVRNNKSTIISNYNSSPFRGSGWGRITAGQYKGPNGDQNTAEVDPALEGMGGYRFVIPANSPAAPAGYASTNENMNQGQSLSTIQTSRQVVAMVLKNHNTELPVTVDFGASQCGNASGSGAVTVPANSVVKKYFIMQLGYNNPYMSFTLRQATGGSAITLDFVCQKADMFSPIDRLLEVAAGSSPQYVNVSNYTPVNKWTNEKVVMNGKGLSWIAVWFQNLTVNAGNPSASSRVWAKINNMPAFDPQNPTTRIYFRFVNNSASIAAWNIGFTQSNAYTAPEQAYDSKDLNVPAGGNELLYFDITRTSGSDVYVQYRILEINGGGWDGNNVLIQMFYNNVIGVEE